MAHRYKFAERRHVNGVTAVAAGTDYEGDELFGYAIDPRRAGAPAGPLMQLLAAPRAPWVERGDAAAARRIIEAEIAAAPMYVSRPIDVLTIAATGAAWIERDPASRCDHPARPE